MQQFTTQLAPSPAPPPAEPVDIFLTHLPANLRAKFGRARCRQLLADQSEVQRVWSRLQPVVPLSAAADGCYHGDLQQATRPAGRLPPLPQAHDGRRRNGRRQPAVSEQQDSWYAVLSEQFNSDYSAGVSVPRKSGHSQETHGQAVLERSPEFNSADGSGSVYKHRRDDFAAYNEVIHVERKFNNYWAARDRQEQQAASRPEEVRKPAAAVLPPPQSAPVSILVSGGGGGGGGGKSATSTATTTAKRVTISNGSEAANSSGGQNQDQNQSLHRANTRQKSEA